MDADPSHGDYDVVFAICQCADQILDAQSHGLVLPVTVRAAAQMSS
jgi:hypothetical protein